MTVRLQCTDCREVFETEEEVTTHAKPETCSEWGNHEMFEATFRVYTDEMQARDDANWEYEQKYYHAEGEREAELKKVRASGHLDMEGNELENHLIAVHGVPPKVVDEKPSSYKWNEATQKDMHEHYHTEIIRKEWFKNNLR